MAEVRRGRPVSEASRQAALDAAAALLSEVGWTGFSVDEVARRSKVGKATIYRHWRSGFDLATQAWGDLVTEAVPVTSSGDPRADLTRQVRRLSAFYASERGRVVAQLLGAAVQIDDGPAVLRDRFFAKRRADTVALLERGRVDGALRADLDTQLAVDLLFGGVVFRLFNGLGPVTRAEAGRLAAMALGGIGAG